MTDPTLLPDGFREHAERWTGRPFAQLQAARVWGLGPDDFAASCWKAARAQALEDAARWYVQTFGPLAFSIEQRRAVEGFAQELRAMKDRP